MSGFDYKRVQDPEYFRENRLDAHSDHHYYKSYEEQESGLEEFRHSLNGLWKFHYARNYSSSVKGFEAENYCCKVWEDIYVPAHIQMEGYDAPQYANVQYPWEGKEDIVPGQIPETFNPTASYVKYFYVPDHMKGKPLYISFQGAESGLALWLNGQFVGYSEDSFTPSEFELTPYLKEGENKLAAQVFKWTASSWCEDQDFFRFSGLYRDVYLYTVPDTHIWDMKIQTILDDTYTNAQLVTDIKASGAGQVKMILKDKENIIAELEGNISEGHFVIPAADPKLWSAEDPFLYQLYIEVYDREGNLQEVIPQKVGFRRFEMKNRIMTLNGRRIVFKGVNRHEFSARTGRAITREDVLKDVITMKRNNINAIRTCHYPDASWLYELCDEYGLYMIDEANLESHGSWDGSARERNDYSTVVPYDRPEWLEMMLDRANSMYQRDKNHPSILIWSCGNESFGGKDIYEMSMFFRREDPARLVHYEGVFHDRRYNDTSDMESQMYTTVENIQKFLEKDRSKPFICCEYAHAMGNSCGAMHKYTDLTDTEALYQGGFIWDYIDQSIYKKDRYGNEFQAFGGDFGDRPCDYNFSGNGIVYGGERDESPKMQEVKFNYQNIAAEVSGDSVKIVNKNLFINTDVFDCVVTVERDGQPVRKAMLETHVEPLSEAVYTLPLPKETLAGEYAVTVSFLLKEDTLWAERGHEIAFGQHVYKIEGVEEKITAPLKVIRSEHNIGVRGDNFHAIFSFLNGGLASYCYAGREMICMIPRPNFWRAPNDNDMGSLMPMRYAQWKVASMYLSHKYDNGGHYPGSNAPELEEHEHSVVVTYRYTMPTTPVSECLLAYEVFGNGKILTTLSYDPVKELGDMPEFGVMFKLDADYDHVEWFGMGPAETYVDRCKGAKLGVYKNKVQDNLARYLVPQECGNKTGVRYAKVTDAKGRGMIFAGDQMEFSALPYTPHEMENAEHPFELPQIHYTVVRVAKQRMGIAGDDSWGARTHPEYLLDTDDKMEFTFSFRGI